MVDLYHIPHDDGKEYRLKKFVEYQHKVPAIDPITIRGYIKKRDLTQDDLVRLAYLHSVTYCEISTIFVFEEINEKFYDKNYIKDFWESNKDKIIFNSARKWVRRKDMFCRLINDFNAIFGRQPYEKIKRICKYTPEQNYALIKKYLSHIKDCGRFAQDMFMQELTNYINNGFMVLEISEPFALDWDRDANMTSGLLNLMYEDEMANEFDRTKTLDKAMYKKMYDEVGKIQQEIKKQYPEQDNKPMSFITKLCSFRNLFKNQRYGGYHHDRQLENIYKYRENYPEKKALWDELLHDRAELFDKKLLGELNGWNGIRKEMKKIWRTKGLTGVEGIE